MGKAPEKSMMAVYFSIPVPLDPLGGGLEHIWSKFPYYAEILQETVVIQKMSQNDIFGAHFCQSYVLPGYFWSKIWPKIVRKFIDVKCRFK